LSGRAIEKKDSWLQFDLNDKDSFGDYRLKEFYLDFGYNLEKVIQNLPFKELIDKREIFESLKDGNRQKVIFLKDGIECRFYIEANPQFKTINIFDENSKKITLNSALGIKPIEIEKKQIVRNIALKDNIPKRRNINLG
jgi:hypothetical protein